MKVFSQARDIKEPGRIARLLRLRIVLMGIVTAEEHSVIGGLASLIAFVCRGSGIPIRCVGIEDEFGQSAHSCRELLEAYGLTAEDIVACAMEMT